MFTLQGALKLRVYILSTLRRKRPPNLWSLPDGHVVRKRDNPRAHLASNAAVRQKNSSLNSGLKSRAGIVLIGQKCEFRQKREKLYLLHQLGQFQAWIQPRIHPCDRSIKWLRGAEKSSFGMPRPLFLLQYSCFVRMQGLQAFVISYST